MVKLTKSAINKFIIWSTSRYNDYAGFGTKKENVERVFKSLQAGHFVGFDGRADLSKTKFIIECTQGNGEGYKRNWRLKGRPGDYSYEVP